MNKKQKDRLRIPVRLASNANRKFYLVPPDPKNHRPEYYVRFDVPRDIREGNPKLPKTILRSTGTTQIDAAKLRARDIIEPIFENRWEDAEKRKLSLGYSTIGELLEVYLANAKEKRNTIQRNANSLRLLVRNVLGGDPDSAKTTVLTADLIRKFEDTRTAGISDRFEQRRAQGTARSFATQARSVVSIDKMKFYEALRLPDLAPFRAERIIAPKRGKPRPPDMAPLTAMNAAAPQLAIDDPAVYVAHLLFSRLALRNIEIAAARWPWIVNGQIGIIEREEEGFDPKGNEGWVPIAPDVLAELMRFRHLSTDNYIVPGATATERAEVVYRRHSKWVKQWIKDKTKTSYELRRYAGSRLFEQGADILQVRDFLRHASVQTTEKWYWYRLRALPTIGMKQMVDELEVVA